MNENINLCKILKGHEGETFYSPILGNVVFDRLVNENVIFVDIKTNLSTFVINSDGKYIDEADEIAVFPSKDQRDWYKWIEEQNKISKTWNEFINQFRHTKDDLSVDLTGNKYFGWTRRNTTIEKSALALLKIHQLIEVGYGGNVSNEEWSTYSNASFIIFCNDCGEFEIIRSNERQHIAFHTIEQAEEFLSYPENEQLLRDYFMIN